MGFRDHMPWVSFCPQCESDEAVYVYDRGLKLIRRFFIFNNRFACAQCNVTWRRKTPFHILRLHSKKRPDTRQTHLFTDDH